MMSAEDVQARQDAAKFAAGGVPMALEKPDPDSPPKPENPGPPPKRKRRTPEEIAADKLVKEQEKERKKAERAAQREQLRIEKAQQRIQAKEQAKAQKIADAERGRVELPAAVFRSGQVVHLSLTDAWRVVSLYFKHLFVDVEHAGYPLGHQLYELRTIQLGGEEAAVVFDAADAEQRNLVTSALASAERLTAHSAAADLVPLVAGGYIGWDEAWAKMHDSVLYLKLTDPKLSGSDASKLKDVAGDLLGAYAMSPQAEKDKNELFRVMGCLIETDITTPVEKNGWHKVSKNAVTFVLYAGSDVLDLAAVMRVMPPLPVETSVLDRERWFEAKCSRVALDGFALDAPHIKKMIEKHETAKAKAQHNTLVLSDRKIINPSSPDVVKFMKELFPAVDFTMKEKGTGVIKDSAQKAVLERVARTDDPVLHHLSKQILDYRHHVTTLGLLLRPLENLCDYGDGRMRPTVYTINADTGRCSCVRPNGQQFSRQGGVRACVCADCGYVLCNADFQGCEIRVAAGLSGDRQLLEAETSAKCYLHDSIGCSCEKPHTGLHWLAAHAAFGKEATKEHRYWCKRGVFTKLFGGGPDTAAAQVYCDVEPMKRIFAAFEELAPVYTEWDKWLRNCFYEGKMVWRDYTTGENYSQDIDGRRRGIYRTYSGRNIYINAPHAFGNYAIQGTARELLVDGIIRWSQGPWGHLPLLPIHDEMLLWVPEGDFMQATSHIQACMETTVLSVPGWEVRIGADPELERYTYWPDSS